MSGRITWLIALLLAATVTTQGCGPAGTEVSTPTPVETERPELTATAEPTPIVATEEPTTEPTESPSPTRPQPSPTAVEATPTGTPQPEAPTATPEEEPTATSDPAGAIDEPEGPVLLEERCTACHNLARVESAQKSRESWADTVDRMIGYGVELSDAERTILLDYLVATYGP